MDLRKWSKLEVEYGKKVLNSGLEGARSGEEEFLHGKPLTPYLTDSVRRSLVPAAVGACLGALSSIPAGQDKSIGRMFVLGLLGGLIGFSTGMTWENRALTESAMHGALQNIHKVRDEHWVEKHPVAYA
jgi:hypothetical protein